MVNASVRGACWLLVWRLPCAGRLSYPTWRRDHVPLLFLISRGVTWWERTSHIVASKTRPAIMMLPTITWRRPVIPSCIEMLVPLRPDCLHGDR